MKIFGRADKYKFRLKLNYFHIVCQHTRRSEERTSKIVFIIKKSR